MSTAPFTISNTARVYVYHQNLHMGAGFKKLSYLVNTSLHKKADNGDLFLFMNKKRDYLKALYYHNGGYCLFAKKLAVGTFKLDVRSMAAKRLKQSDVELLVNSPVILQAAA